MRRSKRFFILILTVLTALSVIASCVFSAAAEDVDLSGVGDDSSNKIYFDVNDVLWRDFSTITCYIYEHPDNEPLFEWGSRKGDMTNEGDGVWSFDFDAKGISLEPEKLYGVIFTADWNNQTCELILTSECIGDAAYLTGDMRESPTDSNKRTFKAAWKQSSYGMPICITSIGNIIGDCFWPDETAYSVFMRFLTSDEGLSTAIMYNGMTQEQTIDDVAETLGLTEAEKLKACAEAFGTESTEGDSALPEVSDDAVPATEVTDHGSPKTGDRTSVFLCCGIVLILCSAAAAAFAAVKLKRSYGK